MAARIAVLGDRGTAELELLEEWLQREPELRGRIRHDGGAPRDGEMGPPMDALTVAVGSGGAVAVLARALSTWLGQRRSDLTIEVSGPDGRTVALTAQRAQVSEVAELLRQVLKEAPEDERGAPA